MEISKEEQIVDELAITWNKILTLEGLSGQDSVIIANNVNRLQDMMQARLYRNIILKHRSSGFKTLSDLKSGDIFRFKGSHEDDWNKVLKTDDVFLYYNGGNNNVKAHRNNSIIVHIKREPYT